MNSLAFGGKHSVAIPPAAATAASAVTNGSAIDKALLQYKEGMFVFQLGAISGGPATSPVTFKIQDSADNSAWADVTDLTLVEVATKVLSAAGDIGRIAFRPKGLRRYVRLVQTNALTGGSSPTVFASADCYFYGPERTP
jgi:hypothetical protein